MKIRNQKLRYGKENTCDQHSWPNFQHPSKSSKSPNQPKRNQRGKERQNAPSHRAEFTQVQSGNSLQGDERRTQCAKCHRRSVSDQRKSGCLQRTETEANQNCSCDCNRRTESGSTFKKCAE